VSPAFHYPAAAMASGMSSWFNGSPREPALPSDYTEIALSSPFAVPIYASVANVGLGFDALVRRDKEACQRAYDALAGSTGVFIFVVVVARLLGHLAHELGDVPRAIEHFEDSLAFCAKTGQQPEYAWTCWGLATVLLERRGDGDRRRAQELLAESLQIATDLGMPPLRQRVEILISQAGRSPAPTYPGGLTGREVEVLRLISGGKTDREIGKELFISIKTVGNHVSNILNKTESANRTEAATFAALHGIVTEDAEA